MSGVPCSASERVAKQVRESARRAVRQLNEYNAHFCDAVTALAEQQYGKARAAINAMEAIKREQDAEEAAVEQRVVDTARDVGRSARRQATIATGVASRVGKRVVRRASDALK